MKTNVTPPDLVGYEFRNFAHVSVRVGAQPREVTRVKQIESTIMCSTNRIFRRNNLKINESAPFTMQSR